MECDNDVGQNLVQEEKLSKKLVCLDYEESNWLQFCIISSLTVKWRIIVSDEFGCWYGYNTWTIWLLTIGRICGLIIHSTKINIYDKMGNDMKLFVCFMLDIMLYFIFSLVVRYMHLIHIDVYLSKYSLRFKWFHRIK